MRRTVFECQGYYMRSFAETRWAEMMDALGIFWLYEPALARTRHGMYLPDFYLPNAGIYVEVKGPKPSSVEIDKARDVQAATGIPVVFAYGDMGLGGGAGVTGGFLMSLPEAHEAIFHTSEFSQIIKFGLGDQVWRRHLRAGIKQPAPCAQFAGEILRDMLLSAMDRSAFEQHLQARHQDLNEARTQEFRQASKAEWAIRAFFESRSIGREAA